MTTLKIFAAACMMLIATSCSNGQNSYALTPDQFAAKVKVLPTAPILDVRTAGEFLGGHLPKAKNVDWNGDSFMKSVSQFDKKKPVFVYCLAGSRSASAASAMRSAGFKEVYEMAGGIRNWKDNLVK